MRKFSVEEAKKMSREEVMAIICEGLAEVAQSLATLPNSKSNKRVLLRQSETFQRLAQLHKVEKREAA